MNIMSHLGRCAAPGCIAKAAPGQPDCVMHEAIRTRPEKEQVIRRVLISAAIGGGLATVNAVVGYLVGASAPIYWWPLFAVSFGSTVLGIWNLQIEMKSTK